MIDPRAPWSCRAVSQTAPCADSRLAWDTLRGPVPCTSIASCTFQDQDKGRALPAICKLRASMMFFQETTLRHVYSRHWTQKNIFIFCPFFFFFFRFFTKVWLICHVLSISVVQPSDPVPCAVQQDSIAQPFQCNSLHLLIICVNLEDAFG